MEIILTQNVENLGKRGEVKTVKSGYFRNYLAPRGLAFISTPKRLAWAEKEMEKLVKEKEEIAKQAEKIKEDIENTTLQIEAKTTEKDTLYGKIDEKELASELESQAKVKVDKKQIDLDEPIKKVGNYTFKVKLADEVVANVKLEVKSKQ